ncbi:type VII secretion integral membrane protein EccD [Mycolicibacterium sp. 3033]|nr:type VII secretion integral membrane protein EccD [Mycolicibacterium aurantiacum]
MTDTVRRLAVHLPRRQLDADLVLPAACPVALLLPALVDEVLGEGEHSPEAARWFLSPVAGPPLDPDKSLCDNGVRDGDLVLLTDYQMPAPRVRAADPTRAAIAAGREPVSKDGGWEAVVAAVVLLVLAGALGWVGCAAEQRPALWVSAAIAVTAAVAAIGGRLAGPLSSALGVGAVAHAAVTGAVAAAGSSGAVMVTFAGSAAMAMAVCVSVLPGHRGSGGDPAMAGCAAAAGAIALAGAVGALTVTGAGAMGALLTGVSVAALGAAAPLAMAVTGIGPTRRTVTPRRARAAHRALTGLTAGWSATAVVGCALVAADVGRSRTVAGIFAAVVGVLLILRQRVHADPVRRRILSGAGVAALAIALAVAVTAEPSTAPWWCSGAAGTGAASTFLRGRSPNPLVHSILRGIEYAAVVVVVPLCAWLVGVYDAVRAVSLP